MYAACPGCCGPHRGPRSNFRCEHEPNANHQAVRWVVNSDQSLNAINDVDVLDCMLLKPKAPGPPDPITWPELGSCSECDPLAWFAGLELRMLQALPAALAHLSSLEQLALTCCYASEAFRCARRVSCLLLVPCTVMRQIHAIRWEDAGCPNARIPHTRLLLAPPARPSIAQ